MGKVIHCLKISEIQILGIFQDPLPLMFLFFQILLTPSSLRLGHLLSEAAKSSRFGCVSLIYISILFFRINRINRYNQIQAKHRQINKYSKILANKSIFKVNCKSVVRSSEAVTRRCSIKTLFWKIQQNSQKTNAKDTFAYKSCKHLY